MEQQELTYRFREMGKQLGYTSKWKPSFLFETLKKSNYSMEEKVGFVLYCYGWNGHRCIISSASAQVKEYDISMFSRGKQFVEQLDNLIFPCKNSLTKSGSHVWVTLSPKPVITAGVSAHFNEHVIPIGMERYFDGYEDDNITNCWENTTISPANLDFDQVSLFLGKGGKVYWLCYDGDSLGVAADNLLHFFSVRFSFEEDKLLFGGRTIWTPVDREVMRDYQKNQ